MPFASNLSSAIFSRSRIDLKSLSRELLGTAPGRRPSSGDVENTPLYFSRCRRGFDLSMRSRFLVVVAASELLLDVGEFASALRPRPCPRLPRDSKGREPQARAPRLKQPKRAMRTGHEFSRISDLGLFRETLRGSRRFVRRPVVRHVRARSARLAPPVGCGECDHQSPTSAAMAKLRLREEG